MVHPDKIHAYTVDGLVGAYQPRKDIVLYAATAKQLYVKMREFLKTLDPKNDKHTEYKKQILKFFKENNIENPSYS